PLFYLFVSSLYPEFSKRVGVFLVWVSALFCLFVLVTPVIIHSHAIVLYHLMMALLGLYIPYALTKTILHKKEGAILFSAGIVILCVSVFYEVLSENQILYTINLSSIGLFVFILVQSVMLSIRFSKAFTMAEILSEELEDKVEERTRGLKKAHEEIVAASEKLKETQHQLVQSQKMEAMGTLAGGIAHEFNNILGTILGYSEMLYNEVQSEGVVKEGLLAITQSGNRAADLVRQILTFSRLDSQEQTPMYVQSSIEDILKVIRTTLPKSITLIENIQPDCKPITANKTQISQVLLNLCTNAVDAMRHEGGILEVALSEKSLQKNQLTKDNKAGLYIELVVEDTGTGINEKDKNRIFDPFYTTKEVNEGTGLGLSIVHGIVKSHEGFINVDSYPGKGTKFCVLFPVTKSSPESGQAKEAKPKKGKGHVLIVEDEKDLLNLYRVMLKKLGYQSSIFFDGIEALKNFKAQPDQYDLVFTDQMMPKLTGFDMSQEMLKIRPEIPIIIATGHSPTVSLEEAKKAGIKDFMTKPVRFTTLSHKLSQLI
ncbi:MAG: response regulator, partial [Proteobacteria bacterium]|nr:response regulator [Pseudomonadota bacterium]